MHLLLHIFNNVFRKNTELIKSKFRCFSEVNVSNFENRVGDIVSSFMMYNNLDSNARCAKFSELLNAAYDLSCPIKVKTMSVKRINSPWLTPQLIKSASSKHKLYLMSSTNADYIPLYKRYRNTLTSAIRNAKCNFFHRKCESCLNNIKKTLCAVN